MCQEKKEEEDAPEFIDKMTRRLHEKSRRKADYNQQKQYRQYKDQHNKNNQKKKQQKNNNNCMDISSDKQRKSLTIKIEYGQERKNLREKLNLFW